MDEETLYTAAHRRRQQTTLRLFHCRRAESVLSIVTSNATAQSAFFPIVDLKKTKRESSIATTHTGARTTYVRTWVNNECVQIQTRQRWQCIHT